MWLFLSDSFLSIVSHRDKPGILLVRARQEGDIEAFFPNAEIQENSGTDYRFRVEVPSEEVAEVLANQTRAITYSNFKDTVKKESRYMAYLKVWDTMRWWGRISRNSIEVAKKQNAMEG